jgi:hypothetical protein
MREWHKSTESISPVKYVDGRITLGWILERWDGVMWTGLVWLRIGTGGEILWIRY